MKSHEVLNFRNFYIAEFFAKVKEQIKKQLKQDNVAAVEDLINNLLAQDDVTTGIEKIAIEQGSSELSIFLFDIFDRIEDYPPTLVYDALPEVVDDFVNGLGLMIEEGDTWEAIQNVNKSFEESFQYTSEGEIKEELMESEESIWDKEPESVLQKPQKTEIETFPFEQFIELEYNDKIQNKLIDEFSDDEAAKFFYFSQIVRSNLNSDLSKDTPQELINLVNDLKKIFPWKIGQEYNASDVFKQLNQQMDDLVNNIVQLDKDYPDILKKSLDEGKIAQHEVIREKKFVREEIPKQPTTIDNLLSEYFQSDVDDFISRFKQNVVDLQKSPVETNSIEEMIADFHSFKEICMIHGYVVLEQFCNDMLDLLNEGIKEEKIINLTALPYFDNIFNLLKYTDKLRDIREETKESKDLQTNLEKLSANLFVPKQDEVEDRGGKVTQEKIEIIEFTDAKHLAAIFHDLLIETLPKNENYLEGIANIDRVIKIVDRLQNGCQILGFEKHAQFLSDLNEQFLKLKNLNPELQSNMLDLVFQTYESYVNNYSPDIDISAYLDKLKSFAKEPKPEKFDLKISDNEQLIQILVEIEKNNLGNFKNSLRKVFVDKDTEEQMRQQRHFRRLEKNLSLLKKDDFMVFPQFYRQIIDIQSDIKPDQTILDEIDQTYRLLIESLESSGRGTEPGEILSALQEVLTEYRIEPETAAVDEQEITDKVEEEIEHIETESSQELEEDLEEIFKQEAIGDLTKVDSAINNLKIQIDDYEQYKIIERSVHSLKSSARLMGQNTIAALAAPLEEICEKLSSNKYMIDETFLTYIEETIQALRMIVEGKDVNSEALIEKLQNITLEKRQTEEEDSSGDQKKEEDYKSTLEEKPLFSTGAEEDEDLLEIFKEESSENIKIIENANTVLRNDFDNKDALKQLENACHSLKSAAKMLGFSEIGQIGDAIETLTVKITKGDISNDQNVNDKMSESIALIKDLTAGNKVNPESIEQILNDLDRIMIPSEISQKPEDSETTESFDSDVEIFLKESKDLIDKINQDLVKFEKDPEDRDYLNSLSRNLHTLKGSAQILHFDKIGVLAHRIEDYLEKFSSSQDASFTADLDPIFKGVDELQNLINSLEAEKGEISNSYQAVLAELNDGLSIQPSEMSAIEQSKAEKKITKSKETPRSLTYESEQVIKISTNQLDQLVNMAAELVVNKTQLLNYLERLKKIGETIDQDRVKLKATDSMIERFLEKQKHEEKAQESVDDKITEDRLSEIQTAVKEFKEVIKTLDSLSSNFYSITQNFEQNIGQISNLTKHLHDDILQVRMVPTEFLFSRFPRAVRDLAKRQKKKVDLIIEGEDTEMDRAMIESLTDPVMHLIRNAVDHGLETPEERKKKGKDEKGTLWLRARRDKNQVMIEVEDDGKGVDPEQIKSTIIKNKLASEEEVAGMNPTEILDYLFHPGFSTKEAASEISGRGIGLDVVAAQLQRLKGDIRINSTPDQGAVFSIRVPLTLAIAQAMLIKLGNEVLAVPLTFVEETIQFAPSEIKEKENKKFLRIREQLIPLVRLADFLDYGQIKGEKHQNTLTAIVIQESGSKYALVVDEVLHREEIVIKSLGEELSKIPYLSGGTIFGDGSVALILDIPAIIRKVEMGFSEYSSKVTDKKQSTRIKADEVTPTKLVARKKVTGRLPTALIIDDSLSVRKFVSSVLERNNYATAMASDGPEALSILEEDNFDIVITDLEMPKMHGFELIEKIREQEKYNELPIVILTGRVGKEHKDKGMELGANAYIVKPFKENDLVKTLENFIEYIKS